MPHRICSLEDCGRDARARGYCSNHYWQFKRAGMFAPKTIVERFEEKIREGADGCWDWVGALIPSGYGMKWDGERRVLAHRWSYDHHVGPIPDGLVLDHLCRNRACVNPWHLEPVTMAENTRRGKSGEINGARQAAKRYCPYGHEYTPDNTYVRPDRPNHRDCRKCMRARMRVDQMVRQGRAPTPAW